MNSAFSTLYDGRPASVSCKLLNIYAIAPVTYTVVTFMAGMMLMHFMQQTR